MPSPGFSAPPMSELPDLVALLEESAGSAATISFGPPGGRGAESCSMEDLWIDALRCASALAASAGSGSVGMVLEPTRPSIAALIGGWIAGFRVVSIPPPSHPGGRHRIAGIANIESFGLIVANSGEHAALEGAAPRLVTGEALSDGFRTRRVPDAPRGGRLVQYTSGSMGDPAGVELTTDAIAANIVAILEIVDPVGSDRALSWLPLSHDMGLIGMLFSSLVGFGSQFAGGGHLTLMAPETFVRDPRSWLRACSNDRATITAGPTSAFEIAAALRPSKPDLASMRMAMVGAEPVHAHVVDHFIETFEPFGFHPRAMCPAYGLAEATVAVSIASPADGVRRASAVRTHAGVAVQVLSSGAPLSGVEVRIIDQVDGLGRIAVRGPNVLNRYSGERRASVDGDGYLDTKDIGFLRDGELHVVGRADDVIIVGGRNLYPADIEGLVARFLSVPTLAVAAIPHPGGYALLVERRGAVRHMPATEVRAAIGAAVAPVLARPSSVTIVEPGAIPRTSNGKLRRGRSQAK